MFGEVHLIEAAGERVALDTSSRTPWMGPSPRCWTSIPSSPYGPAGKHERRGATAAIPGPGTPASGGEPQLHPIRSRGRAPSADDDTALAAVTTMGGGSWLLADGTATSGDEGEEGGGVKVDGGAGKRRRGSGGVEGWCTRGESGRGMPGAGGLTQDEEGGVVWSPERVLGEARSLATLEHPMFWSGRSPGCRGRRVRLGGGMVGNAVRVAGRGRGAAPDVLPPDA